jgi:hypothetical protein
LARCTAVHAGRSAKLDLAMIKMNSHRHQAVATWEAGTRTRGNDVRLK